MVVKKLMKLLFDLDHHIYRAAASCSPTKAKPFQEPLEEAIWRFESSFNQVLLDLNSQDFELYMSGEGNWRYDIYPEYKANRKNIERPTHLQSVREHALLKYKAEIQNGREADDACGIRLTQLGTDAICVSLDKDLRTISGWHYNFVKKERELVSPYDALRNFYKQVLTGDASDNVPSFDNKFRSAIPQFVQKLLNPLDEMVEEIDMYNYVLEQYEEYYDFALGPLPNEVMHRNASVLHIQTSEGSRWHNPSLGQKPDGMPLS